MVADRIHRAPQERVLRAMAKRVVDSLRSDDVDVRNDELRRCSARAFDLVIEIREPRRARTRLGQVVGLGDCQLVEQRVAVGLGL